MVDLHKLKMPGRAQALVVMANLQLLDFAHVHTLHDKLVSLTTLEVIFAVVQHKQRRVVLVAKELACDSGICASTP